MRKSFWEAAFIVLFSFALSAYFLPIMPEFMVSHWNAEGIADGVMPKFWSLFLMPLISLALLALFWAIPRIDLLKQNIQSFQKYYDGFILWILVFPALLARALSVVESRPPVRLRFIDRSGVRLALLVCGRAAAAREAELVHRNPNALDDEQ